MTRKAQRRPWPGGAAVAFPGEKHRNHSVNPGQSKAPVNAAGVSSVFDEIEAAATKRANAHLEELAARPGHRFALTVEVQSVLAALCDDRFGPQVAEFMVTAFASATGRTDSGRECFVCCQSWSPTRAPVGLVLIEFLDPSGTLVAGACGACCSRANLMQRIVAGLERDFGADSRTLHVLGAGGRA